MITKNTKTSAFVYLLLATGLPLNLHVNGTVRLSIIHGIHTPSSAWVVLNKPAILCT